MTAPDHISETVLIETSRLQRETLIRWAQMLDDTPGIKPEEAAQIVTDLAREAETQHELEAA